MPEVKVPVPAIGAGSIVAIYYTHADGSHSATGCWTMPEKRFAPDPTVGGDTIGESIVETCLNTDPGENGGSFVPVISAEIVEASRILSPWTLWEARAMYVREMLLATPCGIAAAVSCIEVDQARIDVLAENDKALIARGFRLL